MFYYDETLYFEMRENRPARRRSHPFFAALMFLAAYFTTITVQPQDSIVSGQNKAVSVSGVVKEAGENWVIVTAAAQNNAVSGGLVAGQENAKEKRADISARLKNFL